MRCPTLDELPPPPHGKNGWPWTIGSPKGPDRRRDGSEWPTISIVTPSFNQGAFIEETIRSILLQGYPALSYGICDGGSTDETPAILEKYRVFLDFCIAEPDRGQVDAIRKGFSRLPFGLVNWINSDDFLAPSALRALGAAPDHATCVTGKVVNFTKVGVVNTVSLRNLSFETFCNETATWHQPGLWLRGVPSELLELLDQRFHIIFDWLFYIRFFSAPQCVVDTNATLVYFRVHPLAKTQQLDGAGVREFMEACRLALDELSQFRQRKLMARRVAVAERRVWALEQLDSVQGMNEALRVFGTRIIRDFGVGYDRFALGMLKRKLLRNITLLANGSKGPDA